jgi:LacI family transcriptional regulator
MAVTLREIALHTGLSKPTVTRILGRDADRFSPSTRKLVLDTAKKLGYRVNSAARAMSRGRFGCIALVLGSDVRRSDMPVGLLMGMQEALAAQDMHLSVTRLPDDKLTAEGTIPKVLRESMADGMIINYTHGIPGKMLDLIRDQASPVVWVNTDLLTDCVRPDDFAGSKLLTEHLLSLGHKRILYTKFDSSDHYSGHERRAGYDAAMKQAGLASQSIDRAVDASEQVAVIRACLNSDSRPTAVIARPEDVPTFAICAAELGLKVPADLSLASISGRPHALMGMDVTSAIVPTEQEGVEAVRMVLEKLSSPGVPVERKMVPFKLHAGHTSVKVS